MLPVEPQFLTVDWAEIPEERHSGESGEAYWRVKTFGATRVRMVRYTAGYLADHWCERGHILQVLSGELHTELNDGRSITLGVGMGYVVGDGGPAHRSSTKVETMLFIVD